MDINFVQTLFSLFNLLLLLAGIGFVVVFAVLGIKALRKYLREK